MVTTLYGKPKKKPDTADEALDFVRGRMDPSGVQTERRGFEQQWFSAMAAYAGLTFVAADGTIRAPKNIRQQREAYNANLILPKALRFIARLQSINPRTFVLPETQAWEDIWASKLAETAYRHGREVTSFDEKRYRALEWAVKCGSGFLKICWDPYAGDPDRLYFDQKRNVDLRAMFDPELAHELERQNLFEDVYPGELDCQLIEPFQQWWDFGARGGGVKDALWMATRCAMSLEMVYETYGIEVEAMRDLRGAERYREAFAFMSAGSTGVTPTAFVSRMPDTAIVTEFFHRPLRMKMPKGRHVVTINDRHVAIDQPNPYAASGSPLPFVKYDAFPCEGRFIGLSLVEILRCSQRAYNSARGHAMGMQKTAFAPIIVPKNSGITPIQITGFHGAVLEASLQNGPPVFGQPPNMPPYIGQNADRAKDEMNEISAQSDPANSKLPGQLRSGSAVKAVQADNNLILTPTSTAMFRSDQEAGIMILQLIGMHYGKPRLVTIMGDGGEVDTKYLSGADLRRHYRLRIISQPGDIDTAEARDAKIFDMVELGILNPQNPEHASELIKSLRFHTGNDGFVSAALAQENSEMREIQRMLEQPGYEGVVMPWFDPMIRSKLLERKLNSREYESYPPAIQQTLANRWKQFLQMIQARAKMQAEANAAAAGAPAPKGKASQPAR